MTKLAVLICSVFFCAAGALAQDSSSGATLAPGPAARNALPGSVAEEIALLASTAGDPGKALLPSADPAPAVPQPAPAWEAGPRPEKSWQLGLSYAFVRFRSAGLDTNLNGIDTSLVRYLKEWLGVEGDVTAAFTNELPHGPGKYLLYGGGVRIADRNGRRRLEPWGHVLFGGSYVQPQQAGGGRSGLGIEAGGGVDWRWLTQLSLRVQGDWMRTHAFGAWQDNFQVAAGLVFNF